jgi:hypothetical protein
MKYEISKSRFDKIIMNYLDSVFFGIEEHTELIGGEYRYWEKKGDTMIEFSEDLDGVSAVGISEPIWEIFRTMFSLTPFDADSYIKSWLKKNLNEIPDDFDLYVF